MKKPLLIAVGLILGFPVQGQERSAVMNDVTIWYDALNKRNAALAEQVMSETWVDIPAAPGQPVVAAQSAVVRFLPVGLDQPVGREPVKHPVQAADLQPDPALGQLIHLTHDAVPVPRAVGQRGEHEERLPRHRPDRHTT